MKASLFADDDECDMFQEHASSKLIQDVASTKLLLSGAGRPSSMTVCFSLQIILFKSLELTSSKNLFSIALCIFSESYNGLENIFAV